MGNLVSSHKTPDPYQFYWAGKRKLYPDWEAVKRIDELVAQTPADLRGKPSKLVPYLVSHCSTEADKFRAIFRWVCDNIRYDVHALNQGLDRRYSINRTLVPNSVEQVLSRGSAVCAGYVNLIVDLCERAGIEVTYVGGVSKPADYSPGDSIDLERGQGHAWLAVKLGDKEYLCDPTWAAGSTDGDEGLKRFARRWDETWFITEPRQFLETHWPRGLGSVGTREDSEPTLQYLEKPMTDFDAWCQLPIRPGSTGRYPILIQPLSHKDGLVDSDNNTVSIHFQYDRCPLAVHATVTSLASKRELDGFVKVETKGKTYKVHVRLPTASSSGYLLKISAKPFYTGMDEVLTNVLRYKIMASGDVCHNAFPGDSAIPFLGPSKNFLDCGLSTSTPIEVRSSDGLTKLNYSLPKNTKKWRNIMGKLVFQNETKNLKDEFCLGCVDTRLIVDMRLRRQGEYLFSLLVQSLEESDMYYYICSHVIICEKAIMDMDKFPGRERPYGTTTYFQAQHYKLYSPKSHFLTTKKGLIVIEMSIPKDRKVAFCIQKNGQKYEASDECVYAEWCGGRVRFHLQMVESGYFTFVMNEINGDEAGEWLACFLIHCPEAHEGEPFPRYPAIWGPAREFSESGCKLISQKNSTIRTKNGCAKLTIKNTYQLSRLSFKLTDIKNEECSQSVLAESKSDQLIFYFRPQEVGNYRFSLHLLSERGSWKACLLNVLVRAQSQFEGEFFTPKPRLIGEHAKVQELSIKISQPRSALMKTKTGRCQVVIAGKLPMQLYHNLILGDEDMNDRVYCDTNGDQSSPELTYKFELPKTGMYNFLVHTNAQKGREVYSAEIECTKVGAVIPFFTAKPVPNCQLGLVHGNQADVELVYQRSATLRLVNGLAKMILKIGNANVEKLMAWYHCTENAERRVLGRHVLVERWGPRAEVVVAPPEPKRYLLVIAAKMKDSENLVRVGMFFIEPGQKLPKYNGFPVRYQPFYTTEGCRLGTPLRTTLERERSYEFDVCIPEATKVVVGGTVLNSRTKSGSHKGQVKVKAADKTLMVSAVFKTKGKEDVVHYFSYDVANKSKEKFVTNASATNTNTE